MTEDLRAKIECALTATEENCNCFQILNIFLTWKLLGSCVTNVLICPNEYNLLMYQNPCTLFCDRTFLSKLVPDHITNSLK